MTPNHLFLAALLLTGVVDAARAGPVRYTVATIGASASFEAKDVNNNGQVIGYTSYAGADGAARAGTFIWDAGTVTPIDNTRQVLGIALNDAGTAAGTGTDAGGASVPVRFTTTTRSDLSAAPGWYAADIDNGGALLATAIGRGSNVAAVYATDGTILQQADLGVGGRAYALNDVGTAVGMMATPQGMHAFSMAGGALVDLGTLGGGWSQALAVNDQGAAVGASNLAGATGASRAVLFTTQGPVDLGTVSGWDQPLHAQANAINDAGMIVGSLDTQAHGAAGFLYQDGAMYDLSDYADLGQGARVVQALDVNDEGQILAIAQNDGGRWAVLLSPVPEPARAATTLAGLVLLSCMRCRRR